MPGSNFFDSPGWFKASDADRALVVEDAFNAKASTSQAYAKADARGKAAIRSAYQQIVEAGALKSSHNPDVAKAQADQVEVDSQGFLDNFADTVVRSHKAALSTVPMVDDALNPDGTVDQKFYTQAANYLQKQAAAPQTYERKQIDTDIAAWRISHDNADLAGKFKAGLKLVGDLATNPKGIALMGAESASTITAGYLGAKGGALAGTGVAAAAAAVTGGPGAAIGAVTIPVGTAVGSVAGMAAQAGTQEFLDRIHQGLDKEKIPYTPANIQAFIENNPGVIEDDQTKSGRYGATMGVVDRILGGVGGKLATAPERAASRVARASAKGAPGRAAISEIAQQTGKSIDEATEIYVNSQAKATMAGQTFKSKLGRKAANYGVEVISEPISEAAGMVAANKEIKAEDLIYETIGGIGAGPYGAAVNKSLFGTKLAKEQTTNFAKKILASTPESRAAAEVQKQELKTAKAQNNAPADYNHDKEVAVTDINDPKVTEWADPKHASYNPVKAVKVLAKEENPDADHVDRTRQVYLDYRDSVMESMDQWEKEINEAKTFLDNKETGKAAIAQQRADATEQIIATKQKTLKQIADQVNKVKVRAELSAQVREVKPIDPETATPDELTEHITTSLGSSSNVNSMTNDGIAAALKRKDISAEQRTMLGAVQEANIARKNITDRAASGKSMDEVSNDVYSGVPGSDFKGIDAYHQGIREHLTGQRILEATKQLDGLRKFRDAHQAKNELANELFEMVKKNQPFTAEQQTRYKAQQRLNPEFRINTKSVNFVANIAQEAKALSAEVALAESLMAVHKNKGQGVASPAVSSSSAANPAAPIMAPIIPVTPAASQAIPTAPVSAPVRSRTFNEKGKMETVNIPGTEGDRDIEGRHVPIDGYEDHEFFVYKDDGGWSVVERTSGASIGGYHKTQKAAITTATDKIIKAGKPALLAGIIKVKAGYAAKSKEKAGAEVKPEAKPIVATALDIDYTELSDAGLQRYAEKATAAGVPNLTVEQAQKLETVNKEIERRKSLVKTKNTPADQKTSEPVVESTSEINDSTAKEISASLGDINSMDDLEVTYIDTDSSEVTKIYAQAAQDLDTEIKEAEAILKCFGAK